MGKKNRSSFNNSTNCCEGVSRIIKDFSNYLDEKMFSLLHD